MCVSTTMASLWMRAARAAGDSAAAFFPAGAYAPTTTDIIAITNNSLITIEISGARVRLTPSRSQALSPEP